MTSATPKPRAGEYEFRRVPDVIAQLEADNAALRERERELVGALEMMLDIDPVLQAPSDYQIAKARALLAKHGR